MSEALELQIESAWTSITRMRPHQRRTLFLSRGRRVLWGESAQRTRSAIEIGTYVHTITLGELREDVFWVHDHLHQEAEAA